MDSTQQQWDEKRMGERCAGHARAYTAAHGRFDMAGVKYAYEKTMTEMRDDIQSQLATLRQERDHWRKQHAECTTALITADREITRLKRERDQLREQLATLDTPGAWEAVEKGHNTGRIGQYEIQVGIDSGEIYLFDINRNRKCHILPLAEHGYAICRRPATPPPALEEPAITQYLAGNSIIIATRMEWDQRYTSGWKDGNDDAQDDTRVCSECEGDGELEDNSHISPPVDGDWPMITCWKCNGTGIEPQPAPEAND